MEPQNRQQKRPTQQGTPGKPGKVFKNNNMEILGFKEGKLFAGPERATLTFFMGNEVASIHFDLKRREIFFKGHNVKNMTLTQGQWEALGNFLKLLQREKISPQIVQGYRDSLNQVLPRF